MKSKQGRYVRFVYFGLSFLTAYWRSLLAFPEVNTFQPIEDSDFQVWEPKNYEYEDSVLVKIFDGSAITAPENLQDTNLT